MVLPLRDIQPRKTFPVVNTAIIIANFLAWFFELSLGPHLDGYLQSAAFVPARFFGSADPVNGVRSVFLSMFLHGGWMHLLGNMLYLWIFGDNVEDRLGHFRYLIFYLACGWVATLAHGLLNLGSVVPSIGASGAIAGVLGAYLLMFPRARVLTLIPLGFYITLREVPAIFVLGVWFVLQFFSGITSLGVRTSQTTGVAWWAHIGGFVAGVILAWVMVKRRPRRWSR